MTTAIRLSIQEVVSDFESLLRMDATLSTHFDLEMSTEKDIDKYNSELRKLLNKYIPNNRTHLKCDDLTSFDVSLEMYGMLYENFKEIFYNLV